MVAVLSSLDGFFPTVRWKDDSGVAVGHGWVFLSMGEMSSKRRRRGGVPRWGLGIGICVLCGLWYLGSSLRRGEKLSPLLAEQAPTPRTVRTLPRTPVTRHPRAVLADPPNTFLEKKVLERDEGIAPLPPPTPLATPTLLPEPMHATVLVSVVEPDGALVPSAIVRSDDCALHRRAPSGTIELVIDQPGCTFQGGRPDGLLTAWSDPFFVEFEPGDDVEVELVVPEEKTAGLGIQFQPDPDGFRVTRVIPGTPADEAGLVPGDILLSVAGVSALELDTESFIDLATGPVGSQVDLVILEREGGGERSIRMTRQALEDRRPAFGAP